MNEVQNVIENLNMWVTNPKSEDLCCFCDREIADPNSQVQRIIYKESKRYGDTMKRVVEFTAKRVFIARCKKCEEVHSSISLLRYGGIQFLVCIVAGLLLGLMQGYWFWWLLGGGVVGFILSGYVYDNECESRAKRANIKAEAEVDNFEPIKKLLDKSWTWSKPKV
ncbi:MAG: AtpZ/AtpI family protein [Bacteroidales bacterium]|jgi:hypothetical protein|nr:AtpZ/AtpI family protein [Bacteroidales bacterium]